MNFRWFKSLFAWETVRDTAVHTYQVNTVTGKRRILRLSHHGYQPIDLGWLETGEWTKPGKPPTGSGSVVRWSLRANSDASEKLAPSQSEDAA